ncbi:MAG: lipoprotein [Nitrosarchaeum sp.]|nr:lipoprotein [Nitrosarchaeum sp.]
MIRGFRWYTKRLIIIILAVLILTGCTRDEIMNWARETQDIRNKINTSTFSSPHHIDIYMDK